jgi:Mn2+/Fe2+ NRAMP family transporter
MSSKGLKKGMQLTLGIVTSVGGFLDMGALATSAQAGANFRFQLLWAILIATFLVIFLVEMSGRFAAVTRKALPDAIREHFGFTFWLVPLVVLSISHLLVLGTEIGGICFALHLVTGLPTPVWALPVGVLLIFFLWRSTFNTIENSTSLLGLLTLAFVIAAVLHHPPVKEIVAGLIPTLPAREPLKYWAVAVSIVGAVLSPYLFYFYSSGAVEDEWDASYVGVNRGIAALGMGFGSVVAAATLVVAAMVLAPRGIAVDDYHQAALLLTDAFPFWGFLLFAVGLGISCLAAALEVALSMSYVMAQTFGWNWGESLDPREDARFSMVYTGVILLASLIILVGVDPLKLTILAMATEAAMLPFVALPFLIVMNDRKLLGKHANGWISNTIAVIVLLLALVLTVVSIPLAFLGGGG